MDKDLHAPTDVAVCEWNDGFDGVVDIVRCMYIADPEQSKVRQRPHSGAAATHDIRNTYCFPCPKVIVWTPTYGVATPDDVNRIIGNKRFSNLDERRILVGMVPLGEYTHLTGFWSFYSTVMQWKLLVRPCCKQLFI